MLNNVHFLGAEILLSPSKICEETVNLIVRVQIAGHKLAESKGKRHRRDQERHDAGIEEATKGKSNYLCFVKEFRYIELNLR